MYTTFNKKKKKRTRDQPTRNPFWIQAFSKPILAEDISDLLDDDLQGDLGETDSAAASTSKVNKVDKNEPIFLELNSQENIKHYVSKTIKEDVESPEKVQDTSDVGKIPKDVVESPEKVQDTSSVEKIPKGRSINVRLSEKHQYRPPTSMNPHKVAGIPNSFLVQHLMHGSPSSALTLNPITRVIPQNTVASNVPMPSQAAGQSMPMANPSMGQAIPMGNPSMVQVNPMGNPSMVQPMPMGNQLMEQSNSVGIPLPMMGNPPGQDFFTGNTTMGQPVPMGYPPTEQAMPMSNQPMVYQPTGQAMHMSNPPMGYPPTGQVMHMSNQPMGCPPTEQAMPMSNQPMGYQPTGQAMHMNNPPMGYPPTEQAMPMSHPTTRPVMPSSISSMGRLSPKHSVLSEQNPMFDLPVIHNNAPSGPTWQTNDINDCDEMRSNAEIDSELTGERYSPSDVYSDLNNTRNSNEEQHEGSVSPDFSQNGKKRLSAFQRLGPVTQPKKPKLTINLSINKEQSVREVVHKTESKDKYKDIPTHLRPYIMDSKDETVIKYRGYWPWKKHMPVTKTVTNRTMRTVMLMEQEQMDELYKNENRFFQVKVEGYPPTWTKEDVLDHVFDIVRDESFMPCFIEHTPEVCMFLVLKCREALLLIHKALFQIKNDSIVLTLTITDTNLSTRQLNFTPKMILKKRLLLKYDQESDLDLRAFTLERDVSHFLYYPLNRLQNQKEIWAINSEVAWFYLTRLNLSHNKLTTLKGFNLNTVTPKLKHLDLSHNCFEKVTVLLICRELSLHSIKLEGNPLCTNYTDPEDYVNIIRKIYPTLKMIDDVPIRYKGDVPKSQKYYCPEDARMLVDKYLTIYFPLLDLAPSDRSRLEQMYHEEAVLSVSHNRQLRYGPVHRRFRTLLNCSHSDELDWESVKGASGITAHIRKWPSMCHDPHTFTVDVMHHDEDSTIVKVVGILKLTTDNLADDELLVAFSRTVVLKAHWNFEYKIQNELLYWDSPAKEYADTAFQVNTVKSTKASFTVDRPLDEKLKSQVITFIMKLAELDKRTSERLLDINDWNYKNAIEHFITLHKENKLQEFIFSKNTTEPVTLE